MTVRLFFWTLFKKLRPLALSFHSAYTGMLEIPLLKELCLISSLPGSKLIK